MMMTVLIIIACILILAGAALIAFVGIRLRFSDTEKTIAVSYALLGLVIDFSIRKARLSFAGIPLFRFDLERDKKKKTVDRQKKSGKAADKLKKKRFRLSGFKIE